MLVFTVFLVGLTTNALVDATVITVPLRRRFKETTEPFLGAVWRSEELWSNKSSAVNQAIQVVTAVTTGDNQVFSNMLVDTGSSFLWVNGGETKYTPGPYSKPTNDTFLVGYGAGSAEGKVFLDQVSVGSTTACSQFVGAATSTRGFTELVNFDGILGLGRTVGDSSVISNHTTTPTFVDSLYDEGSIQEPVIGIYISPLLGNETDDAGGEITFGGVDQSHYSGELTYTGQILSDEHWSVNVTNFMYGSTSLSAAVAEAYVDTGTLPILIPIDALIALGSATNGSIIDTGVLAGWLSVPPDVTLQPFAFTISGTAFSIPPNAYLIPKSLYGFYNISGTNLPTWFASGGFGHGTLGQKFLELYYSVYDSQNERIGFAPSIRRKGPIPEEALPP